MSGTHPADDQSYSLTLPLFDESEWLSSTKPKPSLLVFYWALLLSLVIHLLIMQLQPLAYNTQPKLTSPRSIHLSLNYVAAPAPEIAPSQPEAFQQEVVAPLPEQPVLLDMSVPVETAFTPETMLEPEVVETIIQQQNRYREAYLPDAGSEAAFSSHRATQDIGSDQRSTLFGNVLDSRLRARLKTNPTPGSNQQVSGPKGFKNIYGTTLVELDNGSCMSSTPGASGQPTNWYLTACDGKTNEGEQMMQRVNRDFQNRR